METFVISCLRMILLYFEVIASKCSDWLCRKCFIYTWHSTLLPNRRTPLPASFLLLPPSSCFSLSSPLEEPQKPILERNATGWFSSATFFVAFALFFIQICCECLFFFPSPLLLPPHFFFFIQLKRFTPEFTLKTLSISLLLPHFETFMFLNWSSYTRLEEKEPKNFCFVSSFLLLLLLRLLSWFLNLFFSFFLLPFLSCNAGFEKFFLTKLECHFWRFFLCKLRFLYIFFLSDFHDSY